MAEYTIKFSFTTVKVGRGSTISGGKGGGEIDITVEGSMDETNKQDPELIVVCKDFIKNTPKVKRMGTIQSLEILGITEKTSTAKK